MNPTSTAIAALSAYLETSAADLAGMAETLNAQFAELNPSGPKGLFSAGRNTKMRAHLALRAKFLAAGGTWNVTKQKFISPEHLPHAENLLSPGVKVQVKWKDGSFYPATIEKVTGLKVRVIWKDGSGAQWVRLDDIQRKKR